MKKRSKSSKTEAPRKKDGSGEPDGSYRRPFIARSRLASMQRLRANDPDLRTRRESWRRHRLESEDFRTRRESWRRRRLERETHFENDPEKAVNFQKIAKNYLKMDMTDDAIDALRNAHKYDQKNTAVLIELVDLETTEKDFRDAEVHARRLLKLGDSINAKFLLGKISFLEADNNQDIVTKRNIRRGLSLNDFSFDKKRWIPAKSYLMWVVKNQKKDTSKKLLADAHCYLSTISRKLLDGKMELEHLKKSLKFAPRNPETLKGMGKYYERSNPKEAKEFFLKAIKALNIPADENYPKIWAELQLSLAHVLQHLGNFDYAMKVVKEVLEAELTYSETQKKIEAYHLKANILATKEKFHDALDTINDALRIDPDNIQTLRFKSQLQREIEDWTGQYETSRILSQIERNPKMKGIARTEMASSLGERKMFKEAKKILDDLLKENKEFIPALKNKWALLLDMKKYELALKHVDSIIKNDKIPQYDRIGFSGFKAKLLLEEFQRHNEVEKIIKSMMKNEKFEDFALDLTYQLVLKTKTNKRHHKLLESLCTKLIKKLTKLVVKVPDFAISLDDYIEHRIIQMHNFLNWLNAINNKEKEFHQLERKILKMSNKHLKGADKESIIDHRKLQAAQTYNWACAFAIAGNEKLAMYYLALSDDLDPGESYIKKSTTDDDFLNMKK